MYDRAARTFQGIQRSTSDHVGPGTYDHQRKKPAEASYAPFLSLSNRADLFSADENPGPGSYDLRGNPIPTIKAGGCTLANRTSRFTEKTSGETPGPGTYELVRNPSLRSPSQETLAAITGKHSRQSRFQFHRQSLPPSIPDPKFANGFEEDENGMLVAQTATTHDRSLGPAYYQNITQIQVEKDPSKLYQGVHFGKYSSKRTDFSGRTGPGPGDYELDQSFQVEVQHMNLKSFDRRPELQVARYPESMLKIVAKDSVPGPGQYSIRREMDPDNKSKLEINGLETSRVPFGSQTKRFETTISDVPGPATYNDKVLNAFTNTQSRTTSLRRNAFNQTSSRFHSVDYKSRYAPGPGQYRIPAFTDENFRRAIVEQGRKPPFNVAAVRRYTIVRKDQPDMPGPASYDVKIEPFKAKVEFPTSNFVSNTSRELVVEDIPGPTAYDVSQAFDALVTQRRKPPRNKQAALRQSQFLSASLRNFAGDVTSETPGPGAYDGLLTSRPHGFAPLYQQRFPHEKLETPGPADYELSPLLEDTLLRGTFNSTLNNPILNKLQNRALREEEEEITAKPSKIQTVGVH